MQGLGFEGSFRVYCRGWDSWTLGLYPWALGSQIPSLRAIFHGLGMAHRIQTVRLQRGFRVQGLGLKG